MGGLDDLARQLVVDARLSEQAGTPDLGPTGVAVPTESRSPQCAPNLYSIRG